MTLRVCPEPGCGVLTTGGRCDPHRADRERARGTRQERGYTAQHDRLRRWWEPKVKRGEVPCSRCGYLIPAGEPWDLGHTYDRTRWTGPEHRHCNRAEPRQR